MFRETLSKITTGFKYIQRSILVIAVFVTVLHLFSYFMIQDKQKFHFDAVEQNRNKFYEFVKDPEFQKTDSGKLQISAYRMFLCGTIGETCTDNPKDSDQNYQKSFMGKLSNLVLVPYAQPPASGLAWSYSGLAHAGFVPEANAQGIGFYAIQPLSLIWKVFRNITYILLVLFILVIGFLIMFRANIGSQTVIAIENALPRIVIALLLITFSFAIAGFLIDIMYVIMGLGGNLIVENIVGTPSKIQEVSQALGWDTDTFNQGGWGLFDAIVKNENIWYTGTAILSLVPLSLQLVLRGLISTIAMFYLTYFQAQTAPFLQGKILDGIPFGGPLSPVVVLIIASALSALIALLMPIIISFLVYSTALFLFFRIFFLLLVTYTKILISIIFSPIILLFEAFPGTSTFGYWFKGLFFNLLVFPIVAILIMTSGLIANISNAGLWGEADAATRTLWTPPFLYTIHSEGFVMLISLSLLFLIPDFIAFIKKSFGVEELPFNMNPVKFFAGAGVATGGGYNLFMRSRALTREMGWWQDPHATGIKKVFNSFLSKNPNEALSEVLSRQSGQNGASG